MTPDHPNPDDPFASRWLYEQMEKPPRAFTTGTDDLCADCGRSVAIGDWPFCPHGPAHFGVIPDEWPGGKVFENLGHDPVTLYSRSELKREMDKRGLQPFVRHVGTQDGDRSAHTQRWI